MTTQKERLPSKLAKARQQQEQRELKTQIKEFTKQYFVYHQSDKKISDQVKQELSKLGAYQPFYSDNPEERSIRLTKMLSSDNKEVKNIVLKEIQQYFLTTNLEEVNSLLNQIITYQSNLEVRMRKIKEAKEKKKYE